MTTRTGKIARLPREIRNNINRLLERNVPGTAIVSYLNFLPEVQEILAEHFDGKPISPQNLSEWRHGGYAEWQTRNDLMERLSAVTSTSEEIEARCGRVADHAAQLLAARIAIALTDSSDPTIFDQLKLLRPLIRDIAILRRGDHNAARLKLAQQSFEQSRKDRDAAATRSQPANDSDPSSHPGKSHPIKPDQTNEFAPPDSQNTPPPSEESPESPVPETAWERRRPADSPQQPEFTRSLTPAPLFAPPSPPPAPENDAPNDRALISQAALAGRNAA